MFHDIAAQWEAIGFVVIPASHHGKAPAVKFAAYQRANRQRPAPGVFDAWADRNVNGLLLCSSHNRGVDLCVVDLDEAGLVPWAVDTFGPTPLTVSTSRGMHLYYRVEGAPVKSRNGQVRELVDIKSDGAYVVAPGSVHPVSGVTYTLLWEGAPLTRDITPEDIAALPVFPTAVYEALVAERRAKVRAERSQPAATPTSSSFVGTLVPWATAIVPWGVHAGERLDTIPAGEHVACPFHDSVGGRSFYIYDRGREGYCFSEGRTYRNSNAPVFVPFPSGWHRRCPTLPAHLHVDVDDNGWLLPVEEVSRVTVLQVGRGRGKTYQAAQRSAAVVAAGGRVVAVAPTRALTRSLGRRLHVQNYQDIDTTRIRESVAVCTPSVWRADADGIDLLVLDEVEQQVRSLAGHHLSDGDARQAWEAMVRRIVAARHVLLMDADAGPATMALLDAAGVLDDTTWIEGPADEPRRWLRYPKGTDVVAYLMAALIGGERVSLYCQSRRQASAISAAWSAECPDKTVVLVSSRTAGELDMSDFAWLSGVDALIYTPVMGTGVSIDVPFDRVGALLAADIGTIDDVFQAVARVRYPTHRDVHYHGPVQTPPRPDETDAPAVLASWEARDHVARSVYGLRAGVIPDDYRDATSPRGAFYARAMATVGALERSRGLGWASTALSVECEVVQVEQQESSHMSRVLREERTRTKEEEARSVVAAPRLTIEELTQIHRVGVSSTAEADAVRRAGISAFYVHFEEMSADAQVALVLADDEGRRRAKLRRLRDLYGEEASLVERDIRALEDDVSGVRLQLRGMWRREMMSLLREAECMSLDGPVSTERITAAVMSMATRRATLMQVGIPLRAKAHDNPLRAWGDLVRSIGLTWTSRPTRAGRVYSIQGRDACLTLMGMRPGVLT